MRTQVGRFELLEKLGEGGAGAVYAARDPDLDRRVAVKLLHAGHGDATARARMRREARAAAGISHPNICRVHEVGEHEGELYLVMELLDGQPLSDRMAAGALPPSEALDHLRDVLAALDALHEHGFIHRDLKPSNVFLTSDGIKLVDFGLALAVNESMVGDDMRLTQTGALVGTPAFMAPEQWLGDDVGPATDVFAVGVLAFEMLTGKAAFEGVSPMEMFHAIVHEDPPALVGGPQIAAIDRILQRAMAKAPRDRYPRAREMAADLELVRTRTGEAEAPEARTITRILMQPFRELRPDEETGFLAEALPDSLATALSSLESVLVRVASTAEGDPAEAAAAASCQHALGGTLVRAGRRLRVTAKLTDAGTGGLAWSETIDADIDDVFALQEELTSRIVSSLAVPLSPKDTQAMRRGRAATPEAQALYLRASQLATNTRMLETARDLYLECVRADASFAPAWARLGRTYRIRAKYGHGKAEDEYRLAESAFQRALQLDPNCSIAHNLFTHFQLEQLGQSRDAVLRLLEQAALRPGEPELFAGLVVACRFCGLHEASIAAERRARRLDPGIRTSVAFSHWMLGQYDEAMRREDDDMRYMVLHSLPMVGREAEAIALCEELVATGSGSTESQFAASKLAALRGDAAAARATADRLISGGFEDPEGLYHLARDLVHAGVGELPLEILAGCVAGGFHCPEAMAGDPWLAPLQADAGFQTTLARAQAGHDEARKAFVDAGGAALLVVRAEA